MLATVQTRVEEEEEVGVKVQVVVMVRVVVKVEVVVEVVVWVDNDVNFQRFSLSLSASRQLILMTSGHCKRNSLERTSLLLGCRVLRMRHALCNTG